MPSLSKWLLTSLLSQMTHWSSLPMTNVFHKTTIVLLVLCYPSVFLTFLLKVSVSLFKYFSKGMSTWMNPSWSSSPLLLDPHHGTLKVQSSSGFKKSESSYFLSEKQTRGTFRIEPTVWHNVAKYWSAGKMHTDSQKSAYQDKLFQLRKCWKHSPNHPGLPGTFGGASLFRPSSYCLEAILPPPLQREL